MENYYLSIYKEARKSYRRNLFRITAKKMVKDYIICKPYIPDNIIVTCDSYSDGTFTLRFRDEKVTADIFDKTVEKISKKLMINPNVSISTSNLSASWCFSFKHKYGWTWIYLDLTTANTEQCEVVITKRLTESTELTGYCKLLSEKKYFEESFIN